MTAPTTRRGAMSPGRWQEVQDVFAAALECAEGDRQRLIEDRCGADVALQREVEALLAASAGSGLVDRLADAMAPAASWVRAQAAGWEGCRVGRYVVLELLGAGGMGLVYKARDEQLGRLVALKFLPPHLSNEAAARERFLVEARAAAALDHPNICTIHEIGGTDDGQLFIAMPLYDGETLQARLARGRLPFDEAAAIAIQIARGLERAHGRAIVHRDIKPSNIMLLGDGTLKILDFGIARMDDLSLTGQGNPIGTIAYMSPEHVQGRAVDQRGDIWSLGVLLHEMLTGLRPFDGPDRASIAEAILSRDPRLTTGAYPDVPGGVGVVMGRALAKRPEQRYPSMAAFAADLGALAPAAGAGGRSRGPGETSEPLGSVRGQEPLPESERRRAAVLVTTVSDYGALIERLVPADAHRLFARIRDAAAEIVSRHGGMVNQAVDEEIVSLFGVPAAHEDDELRAVRAALELHARMRAIAAAAAPQEAIRIQSGLHAGLVVAQRLSDGPRRYAIVGSAGRVASRLASLAAPDDVVVSPHCHRLVAAFVHAAACPPVALEAGAEAVIPFRIIGETGLETRLEASERAGLTPYVGRHVELALLEAHVGRADGGEGRVITVAGEAGAGKSRLLHELRERLGASRRLRILQGRCRAYGDVAPYFPFIEIVREALDMRGPDVADSREVVARVRAIDGSLEPFLPLYLHLLSVPSESHPLPRHLQGEHLQTVLLDALASLIVVVAGSATVVVLLEDWHWADSASRAALARMHEIVPAHPILFVVTTRPVRGAADGWPIDGTRIQLEPLDLATSAEIMRAVLRADRVSDDLARRVFERTAGNPFFVEEVCRALLEQGTVAARDGEAVVAGGAAALSLPDTVQAVIRTRLDKLEPDARHVLRVAAVIGREFEHATLRAVLGPEVDLASALACLITYALIQHTGAVAAVGYRFKHVLTQDVSYDSLLEHQRKALHDRVGRAIEQQHADRLDDQAALLAYHFARAEAWRDAVGYGRRAADRASSLSQFADALATLDQVLDWLEQLPDEQARRDLTADVLLQQERTCETLGLRRRQQEIIGRLIAHLAPAGSSSRLAQTYLREGDLLTLLKRFNAADRALSTALRISQDLGDAALERNTLRSVGLLRWHEGRHPEAVAITEHALAIDRDCQDEPAVAGDLINLGAILKSMGDYAAAIPRLEEALAMPALAEDPKKLTYALHNLANVHRAMGNAGPAIDRLRRADEISRTHLLPIPRSFHLTSLAHIELQEGRVDDALRTYEQAIALSRRARHATGLAQSLRTLGEVLFGLGRRDEALPYLEEAARLFAQLEDPAAEAALWSRAAMILEATDRTPAALDAWQRVRLLCQQLGDSKGLLEALEGTARTIRRVEPSPDASIPAFEAALELAATLGDGGRALALRNTLGILEWSAGRYASALTHYEAALLLVRAHGDPAQEGLILNSLGVTLTELRRPEEARTALEESVAVSRRTGERLLEAHALAALGQVSRSVQQVERAARYFEQSRDLRRTLGDRPGEGWMLLRLAETHAALGDTEAARAAISDAVRIAGETGHAALAAACRALAVS